MPYKRIMTAAIGIPIIYAIIQYLPPIYFLFLIMLFVSVGQFEFYRMFRNSGYYPQTAVGIFVGLMVVSGVGKTTGSSCAAATSEAFKATSVPPIGCPIAFRAVLADLGSATYHCKFQKRSLAAFRMRKR